MEEQMNYILMPSLKQRALIKTVITLWNQVDAGALIAEFDFKSFDFSNRQNEWQVVEDKMTEKVQVLSIPESLKKELSAFIKPICLEVQRWANGHVSYFGIRFLKESLSRIFWTPQGTVDKKKTAETFIRDENLHIATRYRVACIYCLKNDILMLWNKMPEDYRKWFYSKEDPADVIQHYSLIVHWSHDIQGKMTRLENFTRVKHRCTAYQYALKEAVLTGNQVATEYFLQKLSSEEREEWLVRSATQLCTKTSNYNYNHADVLCFLLLQMNEEKQIEVLKNHSPRVLSSLLHWPWQDFFMKMAKHVWAFLPTNDFYGLLRQIIRVKDGFKDYDYQYLFREFWQQSPIAHRENIDDFLFIVGFTLVDLLEIKDRLNIKLILEDLTAPDRKKVILSTCERLVYNHDIDSFEFFVQECLTTKVITIKFREELEKCINLFRSNETLEKGKDIWSKVFQLLDDIPKNCSNKRCVEDGNKGPAKRLCSCTSE